MKRFLIVQVYDYGYDNHYIIDGKTLYDAIYQKIIIDPEYFGWSPEYIIIDDTYGIEIEDINFDETTKQYKLNEVFERVFAFCIMESILESDIDRDSNPSYIIFELDLSNNKLEKVNEIENIFNTNGVTIGEMPKIIHYEEDEMMKKILKYIFILKISTLKHNIDYNIDYNINIFNEDIENTIIKKLRNENIQVHVDLKFAEFNSECVRPYLPELKLESLINDLLN